MAMTYDEFQSKYIGKAVDYDGVAGVQCVDLADQYLKDVFGITGVWVSGAREFYKNFEKFPALVKNFDKIPNTRELVVKKGDIVVWGGGRWGHVAIGTGKGDIDVFESFEQNTRGKHEPAQLVMHTFRNRTGADSCCPVLGVLRPKDQSKVLGKPAPKYDRYKVTYPTGLNIRAAAGIVNPVTGILPVNSTFEVKSKKKVGIQYWGELADGRGWSCLTGFTQKLREAE